MKNFYTMKNPDTGPLNNDPLYAEIINTPAFQRLFHIPFMGGLSYLNDEKTKTSRADHSIGVALLAYYFSKKQNLTKRAERLQIVSALLHDISHLPFSHTMDFAMQKENSFSHTTELIRVVSKKNPGGESIEDILAKFKININELSILNTKSNRPLIFNLTHNIDTLDGIYRASKCFKNTDSNENTLPFQILDAIIDKVNINNDRYFYYLELWDKFWELKDDVYFNNIYEFQKILFERVLSYYLFDLCEKNGIMDKLQINDHDLLSLFPDLEFKIKQLWNYISKETYNSAKPNKKSDYKKTKLLFTTRRFNINNKIKVQFKQVSSLKRRYRIFYKLCNVSVNNILKSDIADILSYPLFRKRFERIA